MHKHILFLTLLISPFITGANAATNWWEQQPVCRVNPAKCYNSMGIGYDTSEWDRDAKCRGKKIICGNALTPQSPENWPMSKKDISNRIGINSDFDLTLLNGDCFGMRKTISGGFQAVYKNNNIDVYCPGVLEHVYGEDIENVETGSILTRAKQPTCQELAEYGYAHVKGKNCYGKKYDTREYYIDCSSGDINARIIILNGAPDYGTYDPYTPDTMDQANDIFAEMFESAEQLRK